MTLLRIISVFFVFIAGAATSLLLFQWQSVGAILPSQDSPLTEYQEESLPSPHPSADEDWSSPEEPLSDSDLAQNDWAPSAPMDQPVDDPPPPPPSDRSLDDITPEESEAIIKTLKEVQELLSSRE